MSLKDNTRPSTVHPSPSTVHRQYGNHIRVRVCGVCIQEGKILLLNHLGIRENADFWCPPGGGLEFGETIEECLKREFLEETNTQISVGKFLTVNEFVNPPLHAIELFYEVKIISGIPTMGIDPEMEEQVISDLRWFGLEEILAKLEKDFHVIALSYLNLDSSD